MGWGRDTTPQPELTFLQAKYLSAQGLAIAAATGCLIGVGHSMLNRTERGVNDKMEDHSIWRSAIGGTVLFGGLYLAAPPFLRAAMGFEPVVPGRKTALKALAELEGGSTSWW